MFTATGFVLDPLWKPHKRPSADQMNKYSIIIYSSESEQTTEMLATQLNLITILWMERADKRTAWFWV